MDIRIKQRKKQYVVMAAILFLMVIIAGTVSSAQAEDLPASTFLPFDNNQTVKINETGGDRWIYPMDSNYIYITYQQDIMTGERNIRAQKLDQEGKLLWNKVYNLAGQDTLQVLHMQKNSFVMAITNQDNESITVRLIQIDNNGEIAWQKDLPLQQVNAIASTNDNGFVVVGVSGGDNKDIHIFRMDKNGTWKGETKSTAKWEKIYTYAGNQQASQIIQLLDSDGYNDGYILTGYTDKNTNGKKDLYLMRLDANGEVMWNKNYGGSDDDQGTALGVVVDSDDNLFGFLAAGYTVSRYADKNIYLIFVNQSGLLLSWPGYLYLDDAFKEKEFGGKSEQIAMALVPVPDGFKDNRKLRGKDIAGQDGAVLVGYDPADKSVLVVRFNLQGHVLWQRRLPIPGDDLIMGTIVKGNDANNQELAYSVAYPDSSGVNIEVYELHVFLEGLLEQDKTIPQEDQLETNGENVEWKKRTLKYEAMRDISKEIKDLLMQQPYSPRMDANSGRGEIIWPDSSYYLGNLIIGKADGEGTLLFPNGIWYKGSWKNNMFNGQGYLRFPTGESYEGDFKDHMLFGKGVFKWPTGESYRGAFQYNMREGVGVFTWPGGIVYEGNFVKDNAEGQGVIRWPNGERYEGQMKVGNATGPGSYYFPNGEWYRGEVQNLAFEGVGVYHWPDGAYYVGEFKKDRLYGEGYYVWPNGVQQWGYWKDDRYIGINQEMMESKDKW